VQGRPGLWWTVNGHMFPDLPMFTVVTGDVVRMHISISSGEVHPMHLHGHRMVVLARNGGPAPFDPQALTNPNGFAGLDGIFRLRPDGLVERGLSVMEITASGNRVVDPAPKSFQALGF